MTASKKHTASAWVDPDDAPDVSTKDWWAKFAKVPVKRGRPKSATTKISTTIRLDADVIAALKMSGSGWQTRANGILRAKLIPHRKQSGRA